MVQVHVTPPGVLGGLSWSEVLVETDGNFYVKVVNPHSFSITITNIDIKTRRPSDLIYTVETPQMPLKVKGKEEFLISGRYEPIENIRYSDEYIFYTNITYTNIVVRDIVEHEALGSIMGKFGIGEVPKPC